MARVVCSGCRPCELPNFGAMLRRQHQHGQQLNQGSGVVGTTKVARETTSRRVLLGGALLGLALCEGPNEAKAARGNPYEEASRIQYGPTPQGGIRRCPGNVNPNCVSTTSFTQSYSPAWEAPEQEPDRVAKVIEEAVRAVDPDSYMVDSQQLPDGSEYRMFAVSGLWGTDFVEFIVTPDVRSSAKDSPPVALVLQRSIAGSVKYVWPIQQPVSDLDTQKKRLAAIRDELGYRLVGCDLIECFQ